MVSAGVLRVQPSADEQHDSGARERKQGNEPDQIEEIHRARLTT
jgi:hypothetical protein